jgi:hypothetical protein
MHCTGEDKGKLERIHKRICRKEIINKRATERLAEEDKATNTESKEGEEKERLEVGRGRTKTLEGLKKERKDGSSS